MVVRNDSAMQTIEDTFGGRIALTVPDSQSGCLAALYYLMTKAQTFPPYREVITPRVTPLGAMSAVIDGAAEVAPIDSYAYCLAAEVPPRPDVPAAGAWDGRRPPPSRPWWPRTPASTACGPPFLKRTKSAPFSL